MLLVLYYQVGYQAKVSVFESSSKAKVIDKMVSPQGSLSQVMRIFWSGTPIAWQE
ncbi:MAG: hypothetical protein U0176_12440 [Bacteroidia bacterium]